MKIITASATYYNRADTIDKKLSYKNDENTNKYKYWKQHFNNTYTHRESLHLVWKHILAQG